MYALSNETQMIDVEHDTRIFFVLKLLNAFLKDDLPFGPGICR